MGMYLRYAAGRIGGRSLPYSVFAGFLRPTTGVVGRLLPMRWNGGYSRCLVLRSESDSGSGSISEKKKTSTSNQELELELEPEESQAFVKVDGCSLTGGGEGRDGGGGDGGGETYTSRDAAVFSEMGACVTAMAREDAVAHMKSDLGSRERGIEEDREDS